MYRSITLHVQINNTTCTDNNTDRSITLHVQIITLHVQINNTTCTDQ
jgi:hypothetical protein